MKNPNQSANQIGNKIGVVRTDLPTYYAACDECFEYRLLLDGMCSACYFGCEQGEEL